MGTYQSHEGANSTSDSLRKLERLKFPDLAGKRFLDIGCNEGFFCAAAAERGASYVLGIDADPHAIDFAKEHYGTDNIEFRVQTWNELPTETFDVVLWASAMHYEGDPALVVRNIIKILNPGGLLILECGVVSDRWYKAMIPHARPNDTRLYPTIRFLFEEILRGMSARWVSDPELTRWDPVPRSVFHCSPQSTYLMILRGKSGKGKTTLANMLQASATKTIGMDDFIGRIFKNEYVSQKIQAFIRDKYNANDLQYLIQSIDEAGLTDEFVALLASSIAASDRLVVLEGFLTDLQVNALKDALKSRASIWDARRIA